MANLSKTSLANLRFVSIVISIPDATDAIESLLELELKASKHEGEGSKKKRSLKSSNFQERMHGACSPKLQQ